MPLGGLPRRLLATRGRPYRCLPLLLWLVLAHAFSSSLPLPPRATRGRAHLHCCAAATAAEEQAQAQSMAGAPSATAATLREVDVTVPSTDGVQLYCKVSNRRSPVAFVLSHPYGSLGGNLFNNVVFALTQHLGRHGFTTLRFNFRGVAPSTGRATWRGGGEKDDMVAVCRYALTELEDPPARLIIVGYSFGSVVGSAVAGEMAEVLAYVAVAYPFSVAWALTLFHQRSYLAAATEGPAKPKLFLMGDRDNFTGISRFRSRTAELPGPKEVVEIKGADHFFFSIEGRLCRVVQGWLEKILATGDLRAVASQPPETELQVAATVEDGHQEL